MNRLEISRSGLLILALLCLTMAAVLLAQLFATYQRDYYWTPMERALPLSAARDRVEVYVDEMLLQKLAADGHLQVKSRVLSTTDIRVRINNIDRVAKGQLAALAVVASCDLTLLAIALLVRLPRSSAPSR